MKHLLFVRQYVTPWGFFPYKPSKYFSYVPMFYMLCFRPLIMLFPPYHIAFSSTSYSASDTGSHHSLVQSSPGTSTAICENQLFFFAPCQCFILAGINLTLPMPKGRGFLVPWALHIDRGLYVLHALPKRRFPCVPRYCVYECLLSLQPQGL